ncbi:MAG: SRPBCC family protein, partial [Acidimicrobiales bacterium]
MELTNEFRVSAPKPNAWKLLTDVERIAPLLPGAQLQEIEGDEYRGIVKVKVGPITAQYKGAATFIDQDEQAGKVVLKASGRDTRGQGNASAVITAVMTPDGDGTKVIVNTDLTVTGKVAQFGRGVLAEVSGKLIGQFVDALEADLEKGESADAAIGAGDASSGGEPGSSPRRAGQATSNGSTRESSDSSGPRRVDSPEPVPVNLLDAAGGSVLKRLLPIGALVVVVATAVLLRRRRRRAALLARGLRSLPLPDLRLPEVHLPDLRLPEMHLPDLHLPDVHLPDLHLPEVR